MYTFNVFRQVIFFSRCAATLYAFVMFNVAVNSLDMSNKLTF